MGVVVFSVLVAQSCPTFCDSMNWGPPGSSVPGVFQLRILEWVAIPFSRGSSQPRDRTQVSHIAGRLFATREGHTRWCSEGFPNDRCLYWMMVVGMFLSQMFSLDMSCGKSHG